MKIVSTALFFLLMACQEHEFPSHIHEQELNNGSTIRNHVITKVVVKSVNFGIDTFVATSCIGYEKQFPDSKIITITDKAKLAAINSHLSSLQSDKRGFGLDVRAKAIIFYDDQTRDTLCISKFTSCYGDRMVLPDQKLYQLLGIDSR